MSSVTFLYTIDLDGEGEELEITADVKISNIYEDYPGSFSYDFDGVEIEFISCSENLPLLPLLNAYSDIADTAEKQYWNEYKRDAREAAQDNPHLARK